MAQRIAAGIVADFVPEIHVRIGLPGIGLHQQILRENQNQPLTIHVANSILESKGTVHRIHGSGWHGPDGAESIGKSRIAIKIAGTVWMHNSSTDNRIKDRDVEGIS